MNLTFLNAINGQNARYFKKERHTQFTGMHKAGNSCLFFPVCLLLRVRILCSSCLVVAGLQATAGDRLIGTSGVSQIGGAGGEYRVKPDNLTTFREEAARDIFVAWFPSRHLSITAAWLDLGRIANKPGQTGWYLSAQFAF